MSICFTHKGGKTLELILTLVSYIRLGFFINQNQCYMNSNVLRNKQLMLPVVLTATLLLLNLFASAQFVLKGKVTDASGNPVPGASVSILNTNNGAAAGADGSYELTLNLKAGKYVAQFSSTGFKTIEKSFTASNAAKVELNVSLTLDASGLDEVVVTGTSSGTTRRQLGSYVATVKASDLTRGASANVLTALQGKTPGAQIVQNNGDPAGGVSVRLRGISSVSSSSDPLYIIDGVIVNNATTRVTNTQSGYDGTSFVGAIGQNRAVDINPADIERIEVLNGAAAAAIYGSRANAGVIQIFTKRGRTGAPQISFNTSLVMSSLRKKLDVNQSPTKFGGPTDGVGALTQDIITAPFATTTTAVTRYDYQDYIFTNATGTDNNLSVSGGTDKTKYFLSGSFFQNQGIVKNTDFTRFNFRANVDQTLSKTLTATLGMNYINSMSNEKPDGNSFYSPMNGVTIIGNFHNIWERDALGNIKAVGERGRVNPVSIIEDIKQRQRVSRIISNVALKYKPFKDFTLDYTMGIDNYFQNGTTYIPPFAYNTNTAFWGGGLSLDPTLNGYASAASFNFFGINHDLNATYLAKIGSNWSSTTQAGFSQQYERGAYQLVQGRGLAPFVQTVNGASTVLPGADERSELSISGLFLQQNFKFKNQLFFTGAIRMDGSSVFGVDQRNQKYLKGSASYIISETGFWKNLSFAKHVDLMKIRVAYGQSGNLTGIGAYQRFNTYSTTSFLGRTSLGSSSVRANSNVAPERQAEIEFGADMAFLKNRLTLSVNVYDKKVTNLLINRQIAPTTGFSSLLDNFGELQNKGFEMILGVTPVATKDFTWAVTGIFNHNRNKALKIGQALTLLSTNQGAPVAIIEGQPIGVFYGTFFARDASGNLVTNAAGIPVTERGTQNSPLVYTTARDAAGLPSGAVLRKVIGNPNPDYTATLTNEFTYKKLSARIQLDAVQGVDVFNADFRTRQGVGNGKVAEQEQTGKLPRGYISGVYGIEEWRIDNGSFVKLRELSLIYRVGKVKWFNDLSISLSGRNLISWDNYKGYDPEVNAGGQSTILRGIDFGSIPIPRTFAFGIQAKL